MKRDAWIAVVLAFVAGNLTGVLGAVALFGREVEQLRGDLRVIQVELGDVKRRVSVIEADDVLQAGSSRRNR